MKTITLKKMQEIHPEFELQKTRGRIDIKHKETGKKAVCIVGNKNNEYNDFIERVKENPEFYLNNSSFFRHVDPTFPSPYTDGQQVEVIADEKELKGHFGNQEFCSPGDVLEIKNSKWDSLSDRWLPSFDNPNDFGGFWLQPNMIK